MPKHRFFRATMVHRFSVFFETELVVFLAQELNSISRYVSGLGSYVPG